MTEQPEKSQIESKLSKSLIKLFQIFIVICLIGGLLDIAYPLATFTKNYLIGKTSTTRPTEQVGPDYLPSIILPAASGFAQRQEPGIRGIAVEYHSASINVAADGLRHNGQPSSDNGDSIGYLLGSSTAFGYGVADNQTLAAHLERALKNVRLYNYAGIAQPTPDNTLRWYDLQKKHRKPDFVIIAGANYQIYSDCAPLPATIPNVRSNIFIFLADKVSDKLSQSEKKNPCASSDSLDLAVRNSIFAIENAVAFGRKQGIPFHIVYLPTPFDENVNVENLLKSPDIKEHIFVMRRVYSRYQQELFKLNIPEFINLSNALPSDKMYFLDAGGHLTGEGNRLIAEALLQRIWGTSARN